MVRGRRRGTNTGTSRVRHRGHASRQNETNLYASRGHGRLRNRRQCREGRSYREEGNSEILFAPLWISWGVATEVSAGGSRFTPRANYRERGPRHATGKCPWSATVPEAQGLCRSGSPARDTTT